MENVVSQPLSERQAEVAAMIASGKSNREIAAALFLSERTVEAHIAAIFAKFGVRSRTEIVAAVLRATGGESRDAHARLADIDAQPPDADARSRDAHTVNGNLPIERGELVGRESEVAEIVASIETSPLVTLTGTGGIGKTRTALHVAGQLAAGFADGVWLAELAPVDDPNLVASTIAHVLGLADAADRPPLIALIAHLRKKSLLLVLDNCEHVVAEAARVADEVARSCPGVKILATSRESLKIVGERTCRLPPLRVPQADAAHALAASTATAYGAIALFTDRALAGDRHFTLTDENAPVVADICRRLDGLPLAIELAVPRLRTLSLTALAQKLDSRLRLLTGGDRFAAPRQQTLRDLMDWSYDLLGPAEQQLFERVSLFAGGCTLEMATAACADDGIDELDVLDVLSSLVDKSLVVATVDGFASRYSLLESARAYAREKLAARGGLECAARRHAQAMLALAQRLETQWDTIPQGAWCAQAEPEAANWRAALGWALDEGGDVALGQRLAGALRLFFANYGLAEGRVWVRRALARVEVDTDPAVVAKLELAQASFTNGLGQYKLALEAAHRALERYRLLDDLFGIASAQGVAGRALVHLGQTALAAAALEEALAGARSVGHRRLLGQVLSTLAFHQASAGNTDVARAYYAEELALRNATGAQSDAMYAASNLAELEFEGGNWPEALRLARLALTRARDLKETTLLAMLLTNTAAYLTALGGYDDALRHAREGLQLSHDAQIEMYVAFVIQHIAAVAALRESGAAKRLADCRIAAGLLGFVDARLAALDTDRGYTEAHERDELQRALQGTLGSEALERLRAAGAQLSEDEAIEAARSI